MRRSSLVAIALLAAAANAGAQEAFDALDFPETEADRSAEVDFIMRPTQEAALGSDQFWILQLEPEPAPPIGPPLAGPTEEEAIGPPMAGPERPAPDGPFILRGTENDLDPFAATGLHLGSFVIRPAIEIGVSATDNVGGRAEKEGAVGAVIAPEINIRAEDERYEVEPTCAARQCSTATMNSTTAKRRRGSGRVTT